MWATDCRSWYQEIEVHCSQLFQKWGLPTLKSKLQTVTGKPEYFRVEAPCCSLGCGGGNLRHTLSQAVSLLLVSSGRGAGRASWSGRSVRGIAAWLSSACEGSCGSASSAQPESWPSGQPAAGCCRAEGFPRQPKAKKCAASLPLACTDTWTDVRVCVDTILGE